MGFQDLIKSISDQFSDAYDNIFGKAESGKKYPNVKGITNNPNYEDGTWRSSKGYTFHVQEANGNTLKSVEGWLPFDLQINPQELSQDEIFAIQVTPTLRGVLVEHQGSTLKDILISGTTGVSPLRKEGGAKKDTGRPVLASGHSGFEEFHELRSYFRTYVESKRKDSGGKLRMVFFNKRDNEKLLVEPQKFTMKRSASKPFMYEYQIQLKAIGVANYNTGSPDIFGAAFGLDEPLKLIDDAFDKLTYAQQIIEGSYALIRRTERDIDATILNPLRTVTAMLQSIRGGQEALFGNFGVTRRAMVALKNEAERVEANFNDLLGKDTTDYNLVLGRTPTLQGAVGRQSTYTEMKILNAMNSIKVAMTGLTSNISFYENDNDQASVDAMSQYQSRTVNSEGVITQVPNSNFNLFIPSSVKTAPIDGRDTIQTIAARELGDPDRYKEIVILNGLKPPYIDPAGGNGVLKPGDLILIPSQESSETISTTRMNTEFEITRALAQAEKNLGVDLRVDDDMDLVFANFGDYDLVAGLKNMAQAIVIRMGLEKGSLKRHPEIGAGIQIGTKVRNVTEIREDLVRSLSSDARIESIPFASVKQEGGTTIINMVIKVKNVRQPVPVSFNL